MQTTSSIPPAAGEVAAAAAASSNRIGGSSHISDKAKCLTAIVRFHWASEAEECYAFLTGGIASHFSPLLESLHISRMMGEEEEAYWLKVYLAQDETRLHRAFTKEFLKRAAVGSGARSILSRGGFHSSASLPSSLYAHSSAPRRDQSVEHEAHTLDRERISRTDTEHQDDGDEESKNSGVNDNAGKMHQEASAFEIERAMMRGGGGGALLADDDDDDVDAGSSSTSMQHHRMKATRQRVFPEDSGGFEEGGRPIAKRLRTVEEDKALPTSPR
jgi:hypothetical protein